MTRRLALFDLDNTLLAGDSDHAWGEFLIDNKLVDGEQHRRQNDAFYEDYKRGDLDIDAYVMFTLRPILDMPRKQQIELRKQYFAAQISNLITPASKDLVKGHSDTGDFCLIITATNSFLTTPIAEAYGVDKLIATDLLTEGGQITGKIAGTPCFQAGKVDRLRDWLASDAIAQRDRLTLENSVFYSDSSNDLPLLEASGEPVVVDGDDRLLQTAQERGWRAISLRN